VTRALRVQVIRGVLWYRGCKTEPVMVVLVRDPLEQWRDEALVATDPTVSAQFAILGYCRRWSVELGYDEQKTHQDPRRATKPAHLRSEKPAGVIQEIYALSLGHFVIRSLMFQAAETVQLDPDRLSFTGCFQILKCRLPECDSSTPRSFEDWYQALLWEMQDERTDDRRNRINPRVIKRKMSKWKKKRPEHRRQPHLKKTFKESVVTLR
jgi:hypothetical protein